MRRHLSRARIAGALAATVAVIGGLGAVAAPAQALPVDLPVVRLVAGDGIVTAAWSAVADATGYVVKLSASRDFDGARTLRTTDRVATFSALKDGRDYWVAVTATRAAGTSVAATAVRSVAVSATTHAGVPYPTTSVTAVPGPDANQVTVSWTGGGRASKVAVVAGSDVITDQRSFSSGWYPATTRSITITVPEDLRTWLGGGTGNPVWVKVVQSNSDSTAFGPSYSYERKYRVSPTGTWAFAKSVVPAVSTTKLRVAELNTQSFGATRHFSAVDQWKARAPRLARYIGLAKADLLTTAELATNVVDGCRNTLKEPYRCSSHTQYAQLAHLLKAGGLKLADTDAYARVMDEMRNIGGGRWNGRSTAGAHVFYDPDSLTLLDHGFLSPALSPSQSYANVTGLGVSNWSGKNAIGPDRWLSWAKFETKDGTGRQFYAVAAHFPVGDADIVAAARAEEGVKAVAAIDALAGNTPVVFGGDLNADAVRSRTPAQLAFIRDGWFDASAVASSALRSGMKVSTANGSGEQDRSSDPGYGTRPVRHPYETSRIDYILLKNSPYTYRYANVLRLDADGNFIKSLQGTDHNMQLATIGIASPQ